MSLFISICYLDHIYTGNVIDGVFSFFSVSLFCACIGTGTQLFAMVLFVFVLALVGVFYPYNRGALLTACIVLYALTAGIAGYVAANDYRQMGGENW